jgi:carbonic anhydrase/acetyltransferase-like protein (isoleucine patch superfamily)
MSNIFNYLDKQPQIDHNTFIAPGSAIIGDVTLREGVSIWYNTVIRGDVKNIIIGSYSNIQDNSTIHSDSGRDTGFADGLPTIVGAYVSVGHNCVLHACTIEDFCLIGMGAIIMDNAVIGKGSVIGAGAVIPRSAVIPPFSVVVGTPGKIIRVNEENTLQARMDQAMHYYRLAMETKKTLAERTARYLF